MDSIKDTAKATLSEETISTLNDSGNDSDSQVKDPVISPLDKQNAPILVTSDVSNNVAAGKIDLCADSLDCQYAEQVKPKTEPVINIEMVDVEDATRSPKPVSDVAILVSCCKTNVVSDKPPHDTTDDIPVVSEDKNYASEDSVVCKTEPENEVDFETTDILVREGNELMEYRDVSSGDSSDSSDDESGPESGFHPGSSVEDSDEEISKGKNDTDDTSKKLPPVNRTVKTKGEIGLEDLPPIEDLQITVDDTVRLYEVGSVSTTVGVLVVVRGTPEAPALNVDSILFLENRQVFGQVFEILGPVAKPVYTVRFNSVEDIEEKGIKEGTLVFYAPEKDEFTKFVFLNVLKKMKGSDASWEHNNEPPAKYLEYSDDESERRAKKGDRGKADDNESGQSGKPAKRNKERFNRSQQNDDRDSSNQNSSKRGRKNNQSWPPKAGDFSENTDYPVPPPPKEFPDDYPGFRMQEARPFHQENNYSFRGPHPNSQRFQGGPPARNPGFRPPSHNNPPFRANHPGPAEFRPPNENTRFPNGDGTSYHGQQAPVNCFGGQQPASSGNNRPPFGDHPQPNWGSPQMHRFGERPQFQHSNPCPQTQGPPPNPPMTNPAQNNGYSNQIGGAVSTQWNNANVGPGPSGPPPTFRPPFDGRPSGPPSYNQSVSQPSVMSPPPPGPHRYPPSSQHQPAFQDMSNTRPQGPAFNTRPQGPGFNTRPQGPGFNTRPQGPEFHTGPQGPGFNTRPQGPSYQSNPPVQHCVQGQMPRPTQPQGQPPGPPQPQGLPPRPHIVDQRFIQRHI